MSFTTEVKSQIAANELHPCCMKAELTDVLYDEFYIGGYASDGKDGKCQYRQARVSLFKRAVSGGYTAVCHKEDEAEEKQHLCNPREKQGDGNTS